MAPVRLLVPKFREDLAKKNWKGANNVSAVILMKPFSTCFYIALPQK
jgi:hypothetical protein